MEPKLVKKVLLIIQLTIALLFVCKMADCQDYIYKQFTTEDGLPSSEVYHVFQDSKGYIWFATDNGASRYNGYEFENFDVNDGLPINSVSDIYEDYMGRIWFICMDSRLGIFEKGFIRPFSYNYKIINLAPRTTPLKSAFYIDKDENVYLGIKDYGLHSISKNGDIVTFSEVYNNNHNFSLHFYKGKPIIVSTLNSKYTLMDSVKIYEEDTAYVLCLNPFPKNDPNHVYAIASKSDRYLLVMDKYMYQVDNKETITEIFNSESYIQWCHKDKKNNLWIGTKNGAMSVPSTNLSLPAQSYFKGKNISSILIDNNDGKWFSTVDEGVFFISSMHIETFTQKSGLENNNINAMAIAGNEIFISSGSAIVDKLSCKTGQINKINSAVDTKIKAIYIDTCKSHLYFGTETWIHKILKNGRILIIKNTYSQINALEIYKSYFNANYMEMINNSLWIAGGSGFYCVKNNHTIFDSRLDKNFYARINKININDSVLWLATEKGLWKYSSNKLVRVDTNQTSLNIRILDIANIGNTKILATKGSGILLYDGKNVKKILKKDGLTSNTITNLLLKDSVLWAGSNNGLSKITLKIRNRNIEIIEVMQVPELSKYEIRQIIYKNELLYLATNKGVVRYNLNTDNKAINTIPIYITNIKVNSTEVPLNEEYKFKNTENNLLVNFEALFYKDPQSLQYRYKLIGLDKDWIHTSNREARYYYLPPGKYTFMVEAHNHSGEKSENQAIITFEIIPAIWQTLTFKIALAIIILTLILIAFKVSIISSRNKAVLKKSLYTYMMQALVGQMNPHFIFNTLNSINNFILTNDKRAASSYLTKFSKLMRKILENSRSEYITLAEEINALELYLEIESLRLKNKFDYSIDWDNDINIFEFKLPSLLIQPFIENSIWHGLQASDRYGMIKVKITKNGNLLVFDIIDNGIGRHRAQKNMVLNDVNKKSLGSKITIKRLAALARALKSEAKAEYTDLYSDKECIGTKVRVTIPVIT